MVDKDLGIIGVKRVCGVDTFTKGKGGRSQRSKEHRCAFLEGQPAKTPLPHGSSYSVLLLGSLPLGSSIPQ
ncbi:hypothetical protein J6590_011246 [Homalodisca vitripennis]|nr:hypothetical protein J6590_011246 [Homalodisca vitripennis]